MAKSKDNIEVPINFIKIGFERELVDKAEEGDFYYKITAHVTEDQGQFVSWEKALVTNIERRRLGKKIFKEIMKELKQDLENKKIKGSK